jgi:uncharacterized protein YndB with AHSA1/START domain
MAAGTVEDKPELHLTRHYPVAAEKVWRAWTDPQTLMRWFGPADAAGFIAADMDVRAGGRYRLRFRTQDGVENEVGGTYLEVEAPRRLVFSWAWHTTPERESLVTITLRPDAGGTELDFRHARFFDQAARDNHNRGWTAAFEKFDALMASIA